MLNMSNTEERPRMTYDHNCPYVDSYHQYINRHAGQAALNLTTRAQEMFIETYHRSNTCPDTHDERGYPTTEWEEFVELTRD